MNNPVGELQEFPPSGSATGNIDLKGFQLLDSVGAITIPAAESIQWLGRTIMSSPADGQLLLTEADGAGFTRLYFGGTGSGNCYILQNTTDFIFRSSTTDAPTGVSLGQVTVATNNFRGVQGNAAGCGITMGSTGAFAFSDNTSGSGGNIDTSVQRSAAGVLMPGTATAGAMASMRFKLNVRSLGTSTPLVVGESGDFILNSAAATFTLPVLTSGVFYRFAVAHNSNLIIARNGSSGSIFNATTPGNTWTSSAIGSTAEVWCDGSNWYGVFTGTWA